MSAAGTRAAVLVDKLRGLRLGEMSAAASAAIPTRLCVDGAARTTEAEQLAAALAEEANADDSEDEVFIDSPSDEQLAEDALAASSRSASVASARSATPTTPASARPPLFKNTNKAGVSPPATTSKKIPFLVRKRIAEANAALVRENEQNATQFAEANEAIREGAYSITPDPSPSTGRFATDDNPLGLAEIAANRAKRMAERWAKLKERYSNPMLGDD
jgi:hypothetical protein